MRHGRAKAARKTLQFFARQGVKAPYVVLVDGTFLLQAILHKVPLRERISKLLQHQPFRIEVTRSALVELQKLHEVAAALEKKQALQQARQWGLDECDGIIEAKHVPKDQIHHHDADVVGVVGSDILRLISHAKHSYVVATQDKSLLDNLREMGKSPLLRLSRGVLLLEHPSKAAQQRAHSHEKFKYFHSTHQSESQLVRQVKQETAQAETPANTQQHQRRKRKAKGPNPLSCKKKQQQAAPSEPRKRKRRRKGKTEAA